MAELKNAVLVHFGGGAESVTGVNFLLEFPGPKPKRILLDCGLFQGERIFEKKNAAPFPYDPATIDALFVSHAHIDHTGRIPQLVKAGFKGTIYTTPPTKDIAELLLIDSIGILSKESKANGTPPPYEESDVAHAMTMWEAVPYHHPIKLDELEVTFKDAGHVLGSAMIEMKFRGKKIVFTGDLGNSPAPFLPDTETITDADYLLIESVYGDRNHEHRSERKAMLEDVIEETMNKGGNLIIPAFSFERTQELLFEVKQMMMLSRIPLVPVYLDSPLAIKVTKVYEKYLTYYKETFKKSEVVGTMPFEFPQLHLTLATEESKAIAHAPTPKIIIAGSGMSNGGRIVHHEKRYLPDPKNTLLMLGYQAVGTLGRILQDGVKNVKIFGDEVVVNARVLTIGGYSAHKDSDHLVEFVANTADTVKKIFVVLGEPKSSLFLAQKIRDNLGLDAVVPKEGETVELPL